MGRLSGSLAVENHPVTLTNVVIILVGFGFSRPKDSLNKIHSAHPSWHDETKVTFLKSAILHSATLVVSIVRMTTN